MLPSSLRACTFSGPCSVSGHATPMTLARRGGQDGAASKRATVVPSGEAYPCTITLSAVWYEASSSAVRGCWCTHAKSTNTPTTPSPSEWRRKRTSARSVAPSGSGCVGVRQACVRKQMLRLLSRSAAAAAAGLRKTFASGRVSRSCRRAKSWRLPQRRNSALRIRTAPEVRAAASGSSNGLSGPRHGGSGTGFVFLGGAALLAGLSACSSRV